VQTSLTVGESHIRYGSQTPSRPNTPSDADTNITVREGTPPLPERRSTSQVWCSTLGTALKAGLSKVATQTFSATTGALIGNVVKTRMGMAAASLGPGTVIVLGGAAIAYGGWKAGARASEMMSARSDASTSGTGNGLSKCVDYTLRLAPVVIPLGRALIAGCVTGSPMVAAACIGASLAGMVCSGVRDTLTAPFRGVLPESKLVDAQGGAMSEVQVDKHQTWSTVVATALDGGLAMGGYSGLAPNLQGLVAPFDKTDEVIVYGALRGGFGLIQEGAKAIAALALGGRMDTVDGKGMQALRHNLFDEKGRQATQDSIRDNCAMRLVVNSFATEAMTGLEDAIPGGKDPHGPTHYFKSLALGAGEARSTFVEQARAGETKLNQIVGQVHTSDSDTDDDQLRPPTPVSSVESTRGSPALPDSKREAWGNTPADRLFSALAALQLPADCTLDGQHVTLQGVSHGVAEDYISVQAPDGLTQRFQELAEPVAGQEHTYRMALRDAMDYLQPRP
jgi:hypothetical protein